MESSDQARRAVLDGRQLLRFCGLAAAMIVGEFMPLGRAQQHMRIGMANKVAGMWRLRSVQATVHGKTTDPFGPTPNGILMFDQNLHFVEVLTNPATPRFATQNRQDGTAEEAKAAVAGALGLYGTYTVDTEGNFSGNYVEGSTFPNWNGNTRTASQLQEVVKGDRMFETFRDGDVLIKILWERIP